MEWQFILRWDGMVLTAGIQSSAYPIVHLCDACFSGAEKEAVRVWRMAEGSGRWDILWDTVPAFPGIGFLFDYGCA